MPAIACIPPWAMRQILELFGFTVIAQDEHNWVLSDQEDHLGKPKDDEKEPLILTKHGDVLAVDVMMDTLIKAKLDYHTYFALKAKVLGTLDLVADDAELTDASDESVN